MARMMLTAAASAMVTVRPYTTCLKTGAFIDNKEKKEAVISSVPKERDQASMRCRRRSRSRSSAV
jgi:hypothetical protein